MESLEKSIGYKFKNSLLLGEAVTHPSLAYESHQMHFDNQRLEFLGDAVLQLVITDRLFELLPEHNEGVLTQMRSALVSKKALAEVAREIDLGTYLLMGKGEESSGGRKRDSSLCDAFEALLGAIYLDGGQDAASQVILRLMKNRITNTSLKPEVKNPKGKLQEILQGIYAQSPIYTIISEEGPAHQREFTCSVNWLEMPLGIGKGQSKKEAEVQAAKYAIESTAWEKEEIKTQVAKLAVSH